MLNLPLAGKRIVVTRAPEQAHELTYALEAMGAEVLLLPTVSFAPPENWDALDAALKALGEFDWILFTSQNAVRFLCQRCRELGLEPGKLQSPRPLVAAVGPATAQAATAEGFRVDYVAQNHSGEALAKELWGSIGGRNVLLPRSNHADDRLPKALRESGARVAEITAYRNTLPESLDPQLLAPIERGEVDAIVFASPSSFHHLADSIGAAELARLSERVQFAAIGLTTARALREGGVHVEIEANESSASGLADALKKYFQRHESAAGSS